MKAAVLLVLSLAAATHSFSYDPTVGREMTLLAETAYCDASDISSWSCGSCQTSMDKVQTVIVESKSLQGYVARLSSKEAIVISFRGTEDTKNWLADLDAFKTSPYVEYPDVAVHKGFYNSWVALKSDVYAAMDDMGADDIPIWVTGHSLGAAIGELAAFDMFNDGYSVNRVMTLGTPRVGNSNFADTFRSCMGSVTSRLVHLHDVVPHVPLESMKFEHTPTEIYYTTNSTYTVCSSSDGEDPNCSDGNGPNDSVADHLNYLGIAMGINGCCATGC